MENLTTSDILYQDQFKGFFEKIDIPAKTTLLREGEISKKIFMIIKGCARLWFNNNGKDITFQFFFEGESVSSIESFQLNQPSKFSIETIEACEIIMVSKSNFQKILENNASVKKSMEDVIIRRLLAYQNLFLSRIKDSPQKRYEELTRINPEILKRVPQHYIASYLGITSVSLSRIRNRR
ncbi:Crp/Fnr family transcriptional regulator [Marinifilum breve]|uniref:Crp/Fnr family transcriptional regulator n=1 Tax=Marinifilum breve TaxID=2184082 RepID=A0A2V4A476_9BACT|nr:Crp/Fnr family transcriptional regulator [Marinifilum breve]PXY02160.1 Crp/Fnr family transcriptional regulator [Marinifilum breve]